MLDLSLVFGAYLLGSISSAIIVCRMMGLPDPRTQGSNNPGATNVLRMRKMLRIFKYCVLYTALKFELGF